MAQIIDMPKLSDTMTVGTLVKWLKPEGAAVHSGDMLAEIETDKATMELESFFDGILLRQFVKAGTPVPIGAALCAVGEKGESVEAPPPVAAPKPDAGNRTPAVRSGKSEGAAKPPEIKAPAAAITPAAPLAKASSPAPVPGVRAPASAGADVQAGKGEVERWPARRALPARLS